MARALAETGFRPEVILSSTALRARTTAEAFAAEFGVAVNLDPELYGAPGAHAAAQPRRRARARRVIVVAHDPGMTELAEQLSGGGIGHMPTCAVATFTWDQDDWEVVDARRPGGLDLRQPALTPCACIEPPAAHNSCIFEVIRGRSGGTPRWAGRAHG